MAQVLRRLTPPRHADLVVGLDTGDDAAVWRRPNGPALVATADFFTPIVDDAETWGRIAAANAASDVYAMGGRPVFALALASWPRDQLPLDVLADVLAGGATLAEEEGWIVVGGHTVDGAEPMYGQAVIGEVEESDLLTNAGARPGDALVLTKPLGTGLLATAVKRRPSASVAPGGDLHDLYTEAVAQMTRTNAAAAQAAVELGAHAATDVTGFGLLGHLLALTRASGVTAEVTAAEVPRLSSVLDLVATGEVPGGTQRNRDHVATAVDTTIDDDVFTLLADAQTSGGLLVALPADRAADLVAALEELDHTVAIIGEVQDGPDTDDPVRVRVR